jgi:hypothetical protein
LDPPTRHGDTTIYRLTPAPLAVTDACTLARRYRQRWTIEPAFLHLTTPLCCEINTLGYPPAALFGFAVATVAFNHRAVIQAARRRVHGHATVEAIAGYYLAIELAKSRVRHPDAPFSLSE